ncbi:hypothetical protein BKH46_04045 [Helicobacter sp. 12S02634-8]|uniref:thiamine-phosphate kinase n=1 Tax=Helicobacter sp. 12S02634-8 TaxID=1476199 RepID=UPI000BA5BAB0|nr:thiamine-phosphate kinase [Helicobacter sp. 12S02634-8]PAF47261.1 hypothetical protein BKH46_04045 [Helicobacter sp. 12S02634-8]
MEDIEKFFIQTLKDTGITKGLGDDAVLLTSQKGGYPKPACLPNDINSPVYGMDMFWEGVHFKREWFSPQEIGYKAFLVNISDILVMNAVPKYALLALSLPKDITKGYIRALIAGFVRACREFQIQIIGGDTISAPILGITITMIGQAKRPALLRYGGRVGDLIYHTGTLGSSLKELKNRQRGGVKSLRSRFYSPILRESFIRAIAKFTHICTDVSDGIYAELNTLSNANRLAFKLFQRKSAYQSGEEYEVLFCIAPKDSVRLLRLAKKYRVRITCIGKLARGHSTYPSYLWH